MPHDDDPFVTAYRREHPVRQVAVLLLVNARDEVLLVRTKRLPNHWQPIGGGIDPDDGSPEEALIREAEEETNLRIHPKDLIPLGQAAYDFGSGTVYCFAAHLRSDEQISIREEEIAEARWFSVAEAVRFPMFPATRYALEVTLKRGICNQ